LRIYKFDAKLIEETQSIQLKCTIFKTLFRGREDIYAVRRETNGRAGYFPAYDLDWEEYKRHKAAGGTLDKFAAKKPSPLTDNRLVRHLEGKDTIGIYPLLQDNSSWFIAADFDQSGSGKKTWAEECQIFIAECEKYRLPVYLERSRSGQGGHIWLFFENSYPAAKSRQLFLTLLTNSGIISPFDKNSNFDRLFPNQASHFGPSSITSSILGNNTIEHDSAAGQYSNRAVQKLPSQISIMFQYFNSVGSGQFFVFINFYHRRLFSEFKNMV
jgi:hypothetical protein